FDAAPKPVVEKAEQAASTHTPNLTAKNAGVNPPPGLVESSVSWVSAVNPNGRLTLKLRRSWPMVPLAAPTPSVILFSNLPKVLYCTSGLQLAQPTAYPGVRVDIVNAPSVATWLNPNVNVLPNMSKPGFMATLTLMLLPTRLVVTVPIEPAMPRLLRFRS